MRGLLQVWFGPENWWCSRPFLDGSKRKPPIWVAGFGEMVSPSSRFGACRGSGPKAATALVFRIPFGALAGDTPLLSEQLLLDVGAVLGTSCWVLIIFWEPPLSFVQDIDHLGLSVACSKACWGFLELLSC